MFTATLQLLSNLSASVIAGIIQDMFGRKKCLMTSFVFHILSWVVLNFTSNVYWLYAHGCIVGISTAFSESVVINYIGEFASVSLRGRLFSVGKFGYGFGSFVTFFLGIFYTWRQVAYMLLVLPCILPFYMAFVSIRLSLITFKRMILLPTSYIGMTFSGKKIHSTRKNL